MKCLSREQLQSLDVNTTSKKERKLIENTAIACMKELETTDAINNDVIRLIRSYPTTPLKKLEQMLYGPDTPMKFTLVGGYGFCRNYGLIGDLPWQRNHTKVHYFGSEWGGGSKAIDGDGIAILNDDVMTEGQYYVSIKMEGCNQDWIGVSCGVTRQFRKDRWNRFFWDGDRMVEPFVLDCRQSRIDMDSLAYQVRNPEAKSCVMYQLGQHDVTEKTIYYGTYGHLMSEWFPRRIQHNSTTIEEVGLYVDLDNGNVDLHINGRKQIKDGRPGIDGLEPPLVFFVTVNDKAPVKSGRLSFQASCFQ